MTLPFFFKSISPITRRIKIRPYVDFVDKLNLGGDGDAVVVATSCTLLAGYMHILVLHTHGVPNSVDAVPNSVIGVLNSDFLAKKLR